MLYPIQEESHYPSFPRMGDRDEENAEPNPSSGIFRQEQWPLPYPYPPIPHVYPPYASSNPYCMLPYGSNPHFTFDFPYVGSTPCPIAPPDTKVECLPKKQCFQKF